MKIAYIGIDLFYKALETLDTLGCEVMEVFTCRTDNKTEFNKKIRGFAKRHKIPCTLSPITEADIKRLLKNGCEAAICAGYYFKIPSETPLRIVNIHPSLLPVGRGSWPMAQSILWGHKKSGITIHKIAKGFDTGDILLQKEFNLSDAETHKSFMDKANSLFPSMLKNLVENFDDLYKNATPQGEGEYWAAPTEADYTITSEMTVKEADTVLRAFFGYECVYLKDSKKRFIIGGRAIKFNKKWLRRYPLIDGYIKVKKVRKK